MVNASLAPFRFAPPSALPLSFMPETLLARLSFLLHHTSQPVLPPTQTPHRRCDMDTCGYD
jgi:hypothetical protein